MRKNIMTLAAVFCCTLFTTMFVSCEKEEINLTAYGYDANLIWFTDDYVSDENKAILAAFKQIFGNTENIIKQYSSIQDDRIKEECEALKTRFSNLQSTLLTYNLIRYTFDNTGRKQDTIATYFFGRASTGTRYAKYKYESYQHDFLTQLRSVRDSIGEALYTGTFNTFKNISRAFNHHLNPYTSHYNPEVESTQRVTQMCDSIFDAHQNDTMALPIHFTVDKIDVFHQSSQLWDRTLPANM